jgi:oligopeptide/dipeptide ABC transporter ATP-binding protein
MPDILLEGRDLVKHYPVTRGILQRTVGWVRAVDGVSFKIEQGKTLAIVGESGAGKSTVAKAILLLERLTSGNILYHGEDLYKFSPARLKAEYRPKVSTVQQNPYSSMNPRMRIRDVVGESMFVNTKSTKKQVYDKVADLLGKVGLGPEALARYPHEFSGGQRQRIVVARSLVMDPNLIVLDEPVSALDVSIRAQIMNLLKDLQEERNLSYIVIAHNLATVRYMSHSVMIMYLGQVVEYGETETLFENPLHPYTRALISASQLTLPEEGEDTTTKQIILTGEMPSPLNPPSGCRFHTRCAEASEQCSKEIPEMRTVGTQQVMCHHYK